MAGYPQFADMFAIVSLGRCMGQNVEETRGLGRLLGRTNELLERNLEETRGLKQLLAQNLEETRRQNQLTTQDLEETRGLKQLSVQNVEETRSCKSYLANLCAKEMPAPVWPFNLNLPGYVFVGSGGEPAPNSNDSGVSVSTTEESVAAAIPPAEPAGQSRVAEETQKGVMNNLEGGIGFSTGVSSSSYRPDDNLKQLAEAACQIHSAEGRGFLLIKSELGEVGNGGGTGIVEQGGNPELRKETAEVFNPHNQFSPAVQSNKLSDASNWSPGCFANTITALVPVNPLGKVADDLQHQKSSSERKESGRPRKQSISYRENYAGYTPKNVFRCEYCTREFNHQASLSLHVKSCKKKTGDKKTEDRIVPRDAGKSKLAGKEKKSKEMQMQGQMPKMGGRMLNCAYCEKTFPTPHQVMSHERVHTGARPYQCHVCEVKFAHGGNMIKHIKSKHPKSNPYKCRHCEEAFKTHQDIQSHRKECVYQNTKVARLSNDNGNQKLQPDSAAKEPSTMEAGGNMVIVPRERRSDTPDTDSASEDEDEEVIKLRRLQAFGLLALPAPVTFTEPGSVSLATNSSGSSSTLVAEAIECNVGQNLGLIEPVVTVNQNKMMMPQQQSEETFIMKVKTEEEDSNANLAHASYGNTPEPVKLPSLFMSIKQEHKIDPMEVD